MIQITPQMRVLVAVEAIDGRKGIDSLAALCRQKLAEDPFSGSDFLFRTKSGTTVKVLVYDGQGFWLCQKRLSKGRFPCWPDGKAAAYSLQAYQVQMLLAAGDPKVAAAPIWRPVRANAC